MFIGNVRPSASGSSRFFDRTSAARKRLACTLTISLLALTSACGLAPSYHVGQTAGAPASLGYANDGALVVGVPLPESGLGFIRAKQGEDTRWAAPVMRDAIERAARTVARDLPGGAPLVVGDISARFGGPHSRHGSHQSGRDVDVLFYLVDIDGKPRRGSGFYSFDELGASMVPSTANASGKLNSGVALFDTARNWAFVRALLLDDEAPAQWIFCADGIKARLLAYAARHEHDPRALLRAAYVLHQPSTGNPHRDHFHVRLACTAEERALGCLDAGPTWPWLRNAHEKPALTAGRDDDATLVHALLDEEPPAR